MTNTTISYEIKFGLDQQKVISAQQEPRSDLNGLSINVGESKDIYFLDKPNLQLYNSLRLRVLGSGSSACGYKYGRSDGDRSRCSYFVGGKSSEAKPE